MRWFEVGFVVPLTFGGESTKCANGWGNYGLRKARSGRFTIQDGKSKSGMYFSV